jgi:hypothetical protein
MSVAFTGPQICREGYGVSLDAMIAEATRRKQLREGDPSTIETPIASADLARDLGDLFAAMGFILEDPMEAEIWAEQKGKPVDHKGLAAGFQRRGRASNPLADEMWFGEFRKALQRNGPRMHGALAASSSMVGQLDIAPDLELN